MLSAKFIITTSDNSLTIYDVINRISSKMTSYIGKKLSGVKIMNMAENIVPVDYDAKIKFRLSIVAF